MFDNYPTIAFTGSGFEFDDDLKRVRNLLHDLFNRGSEVKEGDLLGMTRLFISITSEGSTLYFRFYVSRLLSSHVASDQWAAMDALEEIGPRLDMTIRRKQLASQDDYKRAISRKSYLTQKSQKNIELNNLGDRMGRVHVQQPDLNTLEIRKYRRFVEKGKRNLEREKSKNTTENEGTQDHERPEKKLKVD